MKGSRIVKSDYATIVERICSLVLIVIFISAASAFGYLFRLMGFSETNIVIVYILSVLLTARLTHGYLYGILSSFSATLSYNYFFTEPYFTFSVYDPSYIITFIIMTITAIITSALTSRIKQNAVEAEKKEVETRALYQLTDHLSDASDIHEIASISTKIISDMFECKAGCLCFDEDGKPEQSFVQQVSQNRQVYRSVNDIMKIKYRIQDLRTGYDINQEFYDWPIFGQEAILGIVRIPTEKAEIMKETQTRLLRSMIESTAMAMDRFRQAQQRIRSKEEIVQERYRGNLLRAISHDLRTPLSGIMGTSEILMDMTVDDQGKYELAKSIYKDADWLRSLVENILNLTRLQEGKLVLNKELEAVEEIVGSALNHFSRRSPEYEIKVIIPDTLLLIPVDAKLIVQVLINFLDNAIKHTKPNNEIMIQVEDDKEHNQIVFSVIDSGEGIEATDLPNIFQMFYTSNSRITDVKHGIGLGLTICEAIVKAHGGTIEASNRLEKKGAKFSFTLPKKEEQDE